nr:immunoglobulin heavy chain junction region [Macaca mulatta]MOX38755.1 immunoglobulin heavy chain junction region [Macaca mulatta]MOX38787.1 immunoglobulin heavy chain junction region [Macaca mulatta]MOX38948.1 immunoglobulin heavy chain junction region [Macaca mulatta]MOX38978.1 immunoglobulin heavy chain junction region [Macaca mulatta]
CARLGHIAAAGPSVYVDSW